ncbi:MAG: dTMP kinase [Chloroflexota bacterium]|nr:dTMP kinase [Chloroflexota bacterium]
MGTFITLEGPDGSGKTTQAHLLVEWLRGQGRDVLLTREPGGTEIGDQIREVLHSSTNVTMDARSEFLLYSASRAQHVSQVILPALAAGRIVVSDRYADSSLAYQGYGRELDLQILHAITAFATRDLKPDLTLYFDIAPGEGLQRRLLSGEEWNRMDAEALAFHRRVRAGYLELVAAEPQRWKVLEADRPIETVHADVRAAVAAYLGRE